MNKPGSPPSLIVLMDLLLILVFVALLQEKKETYQLSFFPPLDFTNISIRYESGGEFFWHLNRPFDQNEFAVGYRCDSVLLSLASIPPNGGECVAYFHGPLGESIAQVVFQACSAGRCGRLVIPVDNGTFINRGKMLELNPQLANNPFFNKP